MGDKGQIVIPAKARKIFDLKPGDNLIVLVEGLDAKNHCKDTLSCDRDLEGR